MGHLERIQMSQGPGEIVRFRQNFLSSLRVWLGLGLRLGFGLWFRAWVRIRGTFGGSFVSTHRVHFLLDILKYPEKTTILGDLGNSQQNKNTTQSPSLPCGNQRQLHLSGQPTSATCVVAGRVVSGEAVLDNDGWMLVKMAARVR